VFTVPTHIRVSTKYVAACESSSSKSAGHEMSLL
jgi:hypothetical protein